ncbi:MAG: primosomal protein N', partial [Proteobacteria bacterium]|nr:primosomal protein N' [Pseudomonadota bacterium]
KGRSTRVFTASELGVDTLAETSNNDEDLTQLESYETTVLREIIARPNLSIKGLAKRLSEELDQVIVERTIARLLEKKQICAEDKLNMSRTSMIKTVKLIGTEIQLADLRGARMKAALGALQAAGGEMDVDDIKAAEGPTIAAALKRLEKKGLVSFGIRENRSGAQFESLPGQKQAFTPNDQQQNALDELNKGDSHTYLLHGVTGAGKTEVYLQAAANVLAQGKQAIILVPEIALTPLLIGRVKARFGENVAALHSGLLSSQRVQEWRRIRSGEVQIAVGARSALFAPFDNLGLIVVDEEHDDSYKQGDGVRYNARDLAIVRGKMCGCPVVLGSATPSLESWTNAHEGKYKLLVLSKRATPRPVPKIELIDMRGLPPNQIIAAQTTATLRAAFDRGEQAVVLFNRRGYAPSIACPGCGATFKCPSCDVNLVLHQRSHKLSCHYCGFYRNYSPDCKACGTPFDIVGYGTERVEEALKVLFPDINIGRMDADTTATRGAHHRILDDFRVGKTQLLVGTQLVAKGHDFPKVTVVAVVGVDHILNLPDFRSVERTFALVTQVAGRAGRGQRPGTVILQTRHPEHAVFRLLSHPELSNSDEIFFQQEHRQRRILRFPPCNRMVLIKLESVKREKLRQNAHNLTKILKQKRARGIEIMGPVVAPMPILVGRHRMQIILRSPDLKAFRSWLQLVRPILRSASKDGVRVSLDVDPKHLM